MLVAGDLTWSGVVFEWLHHQREWTECLSHAGAAHTQVAARAIRDGAVREDGFVKQFSHRGDSRKAFSFRWRVRCQREDL